MSLLTLDIEKPAVGGRMLARHQGQVVLVAGAIPGERVAARLERRERGVVFAEVVEVLSPSEDRRPVACDPRCGGNAFAHIGYARQLLLKSQIIQDAFSRIGRMALPEPPVVMDSPEHGYRMRARLHVRGGRIGFFLEGSHRVCEVAATRQLLPQTSDWVEGTRRALAAPELDGISAIEVAENVPATERACHLELHAGIDPRRYAHLGDGLQGISAHQLDREDGTLVAGDPTIVDLIRTGEDGTLTLKLERDVRSFFQSNRFQIEQLVQRVIELVPPGPVVDLYAGVGLFGLSLAASGRESVTVVEGDHIGSADLLRNARPFGYRVRVIRRSVEGYLTAATLGDIETSTVIVDPPRTGLSKEALSRLVTLRPPRVVYVSCDVATLARDTRALHGAGYRLTRLTGMDLFPNTAHVETIAAFSR